MMQPQLVVVIGIVATLLASWPSMTDAKNFVETGDCPPSKHTEDSYVFTIDELNLEDGPDSITINCTLLIRCEAAGTFGSDKALLYSMNVTNTSVVQNDHDKGNNNDDDGDVENQSEGNDEEDGSQLVFQSILADWFKFVQTEIGSIPAVFHPREENLMAVDLKKAATTAFQTNFQRKSEVKETDTQSKHTTSYRYEATAQEMAEGIMKVHKSVKDVDEYAAHIPGDVVDLNKEEDQEFDHGVLRKASGDTSVKILPQGDDEDDDVEGESLEGDLEDRRKREVSMSEFFDFFSNTQTQQNDDDELPTDGSPTNDDNSRGNDGDRAEDITYVYGDEDFAIQQGMLDPADVTVMEDDKDEEQDSEEPVDQSSYDKENDLPDFTAKSKYSLKLVGQRKLSKRERRSTINHLALPEAMQSTLMSDTNYTLEGLDRIEELRTKLKGITLALEEIHADPEANTSIIHDIVDLIILEAVYGSLPQYRPAIGYVRAYLPKLIGSMNERDCQMRALIYLMLSRDSDSKSQETLVDALDTAVNKDEEKTIVAYIAFTQYPQPQMIADLEKRIGDNVHTTHPLILAYGALVARASPEVQQRMTLFLINRLQTAETNTSSLIHYIFSLGNTESHLTTDSLLDYLNHPEEVVQISSIDALRYATGDVRVQKTLNELVTRPNVTVDQISAVLHTLLSGVEHAVYNHTKPPFNLELALSLTSSVLDFDETELYQLLITYLKQVDNKDACHLLTLFTTPMSKEEYSNVTRLRRGSNWAQRSSVYDLVAPLSTRISDVGTFPYHKAFIWGKMIGIKKVNLQVGAGGFIGASRNGQYKVYGRAHAVGVLFRRKKTLVDFLVLRQKTTSSTRTRIYAKIGRKTLVNIDIRSPSTVCRRYSKPLFSNNRFLVFSFSYPIRIVLATLKVGVSGYVKLTSNLYVEFCERVGSLTAEAGLESTLTLEVRAGLTGSVLRLARGGVQVAAYLNYRLTPALSTQVCTTNYRIRVKNCIGIYHQWLNNRIALEVWYQLKKCKKRRGVFPFCRKKWGPTRYIKALTKNWNLGSSPKRTLWERCDRSFTCRTTAAAAQPRPIISRPTRQPNWPRLMLKGKENE